MEMSRGHYFHFESPHSSAAIGGTEVGILSQSVPRGRQLTATDCELARSPKRTDINREAFVCRSKSRSVDHGISSPFDLDLLRSKVDDRFESIAGEYFFFNFPSFGKERKG